MSDSASIDRLIGNLEGRLESVERRQERLEENIDRRLGKIETRIDQLLEVVNQGRGGYRLVGILGALVSFALGVAAYFGFKGV